jgi:hypothetical protein
MEHRELALHVDIAADMGPPRNLDVRREIVLKSFTFRSIHKP